MFYFFIAVILAIFLIFKDTFSPFFNTQINLETIHTLLSWIAVILLIIAGKISYLHNEHIRLLTGIDAKLKTVCNIMTMTPPEIKKSELEKIQKDNTKN